MKHSLSEQEAQRLISAWMTVLQWTMVSRSWHGAVMSECRRTESQVHGAITENIDSSSPNSINTHVTESASQACALEERREKMKTILRDTLAFLLGRGFIIPALWSFSFICVKIKLHMICNVSAPLTAIGRRPSCTRDNRYTDCCSGYCCSCTAHYFPIVISRKQLNKNTR